MKPLREFWWSVKDSSGPSRALLIHLGVPLAFGALTLAPSAQPASQSQIITVVAIVAGLLFSMLVLLIELRGRVRRGEDNRAAPGDRDTLNLDYAYYATNHTIIVGFALAALLLVQEQLAPGGEQAWELPCWVTGPWDWMMYALAAHFATAALHCLVRLRRCYEVFGKGNR